MENTKIIYETSVLKLVEEPRKTKETQNGETVEITRTVKTAKPVRLAIQKPDRKLFKGAEMFYARALSNYLKEGLLPYSLVAKRYANDGGPLTDSERERIKDLRVEANKLEEEFYTSKGEDKNNLLVRINKLNMEISNIQNAYADIFDSTAEVKARNDVIEWWVLHTMLIEQEQDAKALEAFFGDGTYDDRIKKLDEYEDGEDPFIIECIKKMSYLISFWFTAKNSVSKSDFDTMAKLYEESMTEYKVEVTPEGKEEVTVKEENPKPDIEPEPETPSDTQPEPPEVSSK